MNDQCLSCIYDHMALLCQMATRDKTETVSGELRSIYRVVTIMVYGVWTIYSLLRESVTQSIYSTTTLIKMVSLLILKPSSILIFMFNDQFPFLFRYVKYN